jgi:hypothetical protein
MQQSLFENMAMSDAGQPVLLKTDVSSRLSLTSLLKDKEGCLFVLVWMLEKYGYVYYDTDDDDDIIELEEFLKTKNIQYAKGRLNRNFLHYELSNGC